MRGSNNSITKLALHIDLLQRWRALRTPRIPQRDEEGEVILNLEKMNGMNDMI